MKEEDGSWYRGDKHSVCEYIDKYRIIFTVMHAIIIVGGEAIVTKDRYTLTKQAIILIEKS